MCKTRSRGACACIGMYKLNPITVWVFMYCASSCPSKPIIIDISISHSTSVCRIDILVWRDLGSIRKNASTVGVVSLVAKARRLRRKARARDKGRIRLRGRARLLWSRFSVSIRDLLCVFIGARA